MKSLAFIGSAALLALGVIAATRTPPAPSNGRGVAVVELFTSQGCSSCPPADVVLSELGKEKFDGVVVPLAFHVDYWNQIGWTDPFSSPRWSDRQRAYAAAMKSTQVYTPQVVINGREQLVGSYGSRVRAEIAKQLKSDARGTVAIRNVQRNGSNVTVDFDASLRGAGAADVQVVVFESGVTTSVASGENSGRKLTNDFIVRAMKTAPLGSKSVTLPLDARWRTQQLGVAVFLQDPKSLAIYGAATTEKNFVARVDLADSRSMYQ
ncbi:MAG TPA: DUF1223 domain-containing protein [Thermoanaerobaculia bacterium]